jgi:hypothetical protein
VTVRQRHTSDSDLPGGHAERTFTLPDHGGQREGALS